MLTEIAEALGLPPDATAAEAIQAIEARSDPQVDALQEAAEAMTQAAKRAAAVAEDVLRGPTDDMADESALAGAGDAAEVVEFPAGARPVDIRELGAAAGGGADVWDETVTGRVWFRRDWLDRHAIDPTQCSVIGVAGESMEPTLPEGCSILVDRRRRRRHVKHIYTVRTGDGLVVKRADKDEAGRWLMVSDHPAWPSTRWPVDAEIIGEVRWMARTL